MIDHVVRRGLQHASSGMDMLRHKASEGSVEIPPWGVALIASIFITFAVGIVATEYVLKDVVATLCMVETPSAAITVSGPEASESAAKSEKEGLLETAPTITLVRNKPLTSSIRATLRHVRSQGGRMACFRGFGIRAVWTLCFASITHVAAPHSFSYRPFRMIFTHALAGAVCANVHAAWTNKVLTKPSATSFWQRVPSSKSWKALALPAALSAAMPHVVIFIITISFHLLGLHCASHHQVREFTPGQVTSLIVRYAFLVLIGILCTLFLTLPASVTQTRIEASMIPEDQDMIVPFDRTFDGKVVPTHMGGSGTVSFLDAWRSFNWEARRRLFKLYVKIFVVMAGAIFVFAHIVMLALFGVMGSSFGKMISQASHHNKLQ